MRATLLNETADDQLAELDAALSQVVTARLAEPCPGRAKLGDGTIAAVAVHTLGNYRRIAQFAAGVPASVDSRARHNGAPRVAGLEPDVLRARVEEARDGLAAIRDLSSEQLDSVPAAGEMRFADGQRTLREVLSSLLKHQRHQVDALVGALS